MEKSHWVAKETIICSFERSHGSYSMGLSSKGSENAFLFEQKATALWVLSNLCRTLPTGEPSSLVRPSGVFPWDRNQPEMSMLSQFLSSCRETYYCYIVHKMFKCKSELTDLKSIISYHPTGLIMLYPLLYAENYLYKFQSLWIWAPHSVSRGNSRHCPALFLLRLSMMVPQKPVGLYPTK